MKQTDKLLKLLDKLITDEDRIVTGAHPSHHTGSLMITDRRGIALWSNNLILFNSMAGPLVKPWSDRLDHDGVVLILEYLLRPLSALKAIRGAIAEDLLVRYEDLVIADTIGNLLEQANYLLEQNFFLAAGVIYRSLLEERLRILCQRNAVDAGKNRLSVITTRLFISRKFLTRARCCS